MTQGMTHPLTDISVIADIRQRFEASENSGDTDATAELLSDDAVLIVPDYPVQEGKAACVAFLCEVMRYLVAGADVELCNLERQRRFWRAHLQPWIERMCDAVQSHDAAGVYAALAGFTRAFAQVETQALDMIE